ncbi:MAG: PTS sugar transporter subunit IIA [Lachnospiraceae bacterium]|nr:PTS sugar transporter subunit IIA [Lachnospiraceae bacterium]
MLSQGAKDILKVLVEENGIYVTTKKIAQLIHISERSVNTYLKEVGEFCDNNGYCLIRKRGRGICLQAGSDLEEIKAIICEKDNSFDNSSARINYIIRTLIDNGGAYTSCQLADELYVSHKTVRSDCEKIEEKFKNEPLSLIKTCGKGVQIIGKEADLRNMLISCNKKIFFDRSSKVSKEPDLRMPASTYVRLSSQYTEKIAAGVISCLQQLERNTGYQFNDYTFNMLIEYTCCQLRRIRRNCFLDQAPISKLTLVNEILDWADQFVQLLNRKFSMNIDPRESLYMYILFLGAEVQNSSKIVNKDFLIEKEISIEEINNKIILYMSSIIGVNFEQDYILARSLALFLNSSLVRVKYGLEIESPYMEDIKHYYSVLFSACMTACQIYEELVDHFPSESEISYMTLLFGGAMPENERKRSINTAIVGSGSIGMIQIVAQKIEMKVEEINVVNVVPSNTGMFIKPEQYDLVITTLPDLKIRHSNVVYTTPLVNVQDVFRIKKVCKNIKHHKIIQKEVTLSSLLKNEFIMFERALTREILLKKVCDRLLKEGYVREGFYESVMQREEISSSALGGGIAVPHGMSQYVIRPAVAIIKTDDKVQWGDSTADVIFLLALNFQEIESTRAFFSAFYEITMQTDAVNQIRMAGNVEEIREIIQKYS